MSYKDWVLPFDSISSQVIGKDSCTLYTGKMIREDVAVSMLYIGSCCLNDHVFNYSYIVRVMQFLSEMKDSARNDLRLIFRGSLGRSRFCKVYGLWMNLDDGGVFLVCEIVNCGDLMNFSVELNRGCFAVVGMELCEALDSLHNTGLVSGCLALSCFSLDQFGHVYVNVNEVLVLGRKIRKCISETSDNSEIETIFGDGLRVGAFVSPELLLHLLHNDGVAIKFSVQQSSDVWSLVCILISFLLGNSFTEDLLKRLYHHLLDIRKESSTEKLELYSGSIKRVSSTLETSFGSEFVPLHQILCRCLEFDPSNRPNVTDIWKCIRGLLIKPNADVLSSVDSLGTTGNSIHCLVLGDLCHVLKKNHDEFQRQADLDSHTTGGGADLHQNKDERAEKDVLEGLRMGKFESTDLKGHLDCITGLAVGGGLLFSSSFDKTVHVWSLQNLSHLQALRGHEHRVMAVAFVDAAEPLCISGDSGGGLFVWGVGTSFGQDPLKKLYEEKDWRYSGIHALAVSGTDHIYTGSGDMSVKAWSLQDYTLKCTMNGHKSVVSALAVCGGVLYSGSWDGTIRLWSINDHSPLSVLGDEEPGTTAPVLSLSVDHHMLAAAHENGSVKLWKNDVLLKPIETQGGAIFALGIKEKWLFMGGWDRTLDVKEVSGDDLHIDLRSVGSIACDSVITALLYWEGKLFVGFADRIIKVYHYT